MYQATLPLCLHRLLLAEAKKTKSGQVNINKVVVRRLYENAKSELSADDRRAVESFLAKS